MIGRGGSSALGAHAFQRWILSEYLVSLGASSVYYLVAVGYQAYHQQCTRLQDMDLAAVYGQVIL
jgi:hypothetical protein